MITIALMSSLSHAAPVLPYPYVARQLADGATISQIYGVEVADGTAWVSGNDDQLLAFDLDTGDPTTLIAGLPLGASGRMVMGDGRPGTGTDLILADWNSVETADCCNGSVFRLDPSDGSIIETLATGAPGRAVADPFGVALGPGGLWGDGVFVMDFEGASVETPILYQIDGNGLVSVVKEDPVQWTTLNEPSDLAFSTLPAFGDDLFLTDPVGNTVWRLTASGVLTPFVVADTNLRNPDAVGFVAGIGGFDAGMYGLDHAGWFGTIDAAGETTTWSPSMGGPGVGQADFAFTADEQRLIVGIYDEVWDIYRDGDADGVPDYTETDLQLSASEPLGVGSPATFTIQGADPGEKVFFLFTLSGTGPGACAGQLDGLCIDVVGPLYGKAAVADGAGTATLTLTLPGPTSPRLCAQGAVRRGAASTKSNAACWDVSP